MNRIARVLALTLVTAFLPVALRAQERPAAGEIRGTVVSAATGAPLVAANVVVRSPGDTATAARAVTGADGRFRLQGVRPGRWRVTATQIGHSPASTEVTLAAGAGADAGTLRLAAAAIMLEGLTATSERSAVAVAPDRTIYSTRDMPVSAGGMATDVLRSVPELEVDVNGGVQLRGTTPRVFLNGRPAPMDGQALELFLQQFPADRIERIEVIANPSSRYEAEGSGGIVNIVLKENTDLGLSGNAYVNSGTRGDVGLGGRVTWQRGRLTLTGGSFVRVSDRESRTYDLRQNLLTTPVTFLEQDGRSDREDLSGNLDLRAEWRVGSKGTLFGEASAFRFGGTTDGNTLYTRMDAERVPTFRYDRLTDGESVNLSGELAAGYRHAFAERGHELSVEVERQMRNNDTDTRIIERPVALGGGTAAEEELTIDDQERDNSDTSVRADYVRPLGEMTQLEIGYRARFDRTDDQRILEAYPTAGGAPVTTERGFKHNQDFHSAYVTLMRTLGPVGIQAGLRAEAADATLELPGGERVETDDFTFFPNANVSLDLGGGRQLRASYSRRIRRPGPWVLNPTNSSNDPLNRQVGNPDIDPVNTQSLSLEASWTSNFGSLRVSPYYRHTTGEWAQIKTVDGAGVSTVTWENLAKVDAYGATASLALQPIYGVRGSFSLSGSREERDGRNLALDVSGTSMRWSANTNLSAAVNRNLDVQGMMSYSPARDVPQGRVGSTLMTHVGLRQRLMNGRGSLNVMVTDPLDRFRNSFTTSDPTHVQIGRTRQSMRQATVTFSYSFGRPPRERAQRGEGEEGMPEEIIRD